jgi:putative thioredoxin
MTPVQSVTTQDFDERVLQGSRRRPVLVDFWAPWCGPCQVLGPTLEQVAAEYGERLAVVKINTDEEPELAQRFGIRGIPAVKLFRDGRVVAEFTGVQPLAAVRTFLAPHLPRESESQRLAALEQASAGHVAAAIEALRAVLTADPGNTTATFDLIRLLAREGHIEDAESLLGSLPAAVQLQPEATAARAFLRLAAVASRPQGRPHGEARAKAAHALLAGEVTAALDGWIELMEADRRFARGEGREDLLQAFELVGADDPRVAPYRRRLAALLH